jgi:ABC-type sugar transport system permease subunit
MIHRDEHLAGDREDRSWVVEFMVIMRLVSCVYRNQSLQNYVEIFAPGSYFLYPVGFTLVWAVGATTIEFFFAMVGLPLRIA